jgi:SAM-dependent methyltransferase
MTSALDYDRIAYLYDSYVQFADDLPFFLQLCQTIEGSVLELMCGTGRISLPLVEAGINLTCVDASSAMLAILRQKLAAKALNARVVQADITQLNWDSQFDLVLLPFQSLHELHPVSEQQKAIEKIARSLKPNGRFICTLHNPQVRLQSIGSNPSHYGPFPRIDGVGLVSLSIALNYDLETGMVRGWQTIYELDSAERTVAEHHLPVQFLLLEFDAVRELLHSANFAIEEVLGNYDRAPFVPETSPYIIVRAQKRASSH